MLRGQPRLRGQITMRILERCQSTDKTKDAIVIDDDSEDADVVLVDNPSTANVRSKNASTIKLNCLPRCVIYIDDEDEQASILSGDPTSNEIDETFNSSSLSEDSKDGDCVMFVGNANFRCDHSGPSRNHFSLYVDTESSTTESANLKSDSYECDEFEGSSSDCEIMEDHLGNIREQWEKAASKKEDGPFVSDHANESSTTYPEDTSHKPILQNTDFGNCFEKFPSNHLEEVFPEFDLRSLNNDEQGPSVTVHSADENIDFLQRNIVNISVSESCINNHIPFEDPYSWWKYKSNPSEYPHKFNSKDAFILDDEDTRGPSKYSSFAYQNNVKTSCNSPTLDREDVLKDNVLFKERMTQKVDCSYNTQSKNEMLAEQVVDLKENNGEDCNEFSPFCSQQYEDPFICAEGSIDFDKMDGNVNNNLEQNETSTGPTCHNESDMPNFYENLIGDRERHKKTDQYKQAAEEEWASRQQQLQIQAEEAQRMRKRRKAEKLKLLDMEKRQKERLQEIRDLHKKDEETSQLKEHIRAEVRRDLEMVEKNCMDMASVLRVLGIHVKGGVIPMAHEINAAYKQAVLRFHPDRAPRTDIRQQVEAEEKFKLISRLKEKLLF